jgi:hypothetical protein
MAKKLEHVIAARLQAEKLGASIDFEHRTRHICGTISMNGKRRKIFLSVSTKSGSVCDVVREDVRKKVKEMME